MIPITRLMHVFHGQKIFFAPGWESALKAIGLKNKKSWVNLSVGEHIAKSPKTNCFRIQLANGEVVYFKRYVYLSDKKIRHWLLPSKPAVEVFGYQCLTELGIPCLEVVSYGERRFLGNLQAAYIVTLDQPNTLSLADYARDVWYELGEPEKSRVFKSVRDQLLDQLKTAHNAGFFHHDLKWRNLLVQSSGPDLRLIWIDCPRAHRRNLLGHHARIVDLSALSRLAISYLSLKQRYQFILDYLEVRPGSEAARKWFNTVSDHLSRRPPRSVALPARERL